MTYGETDTYTQKQFAISYKHKDKWVGKEPQGKTPRFQNMMKLLSKEKYLNVVFTGTALRRVVIPAERIWAVMFRRMPIPFP